jgi:hypothetical protein
MSKKKNLFLPVIFFVVGIIMAILPTKTLLIRISSLLIIYVSLAFIAWNFWWVEDRLWRRLTSLVLLFLCLSGFAYLILYTEQPNIKMSLIASPINYSPGVDIKGIKWQGNYREYIFDISNNSEKTELSNIHILLEMPWVFIKYDIENNHGTDGVRLSQPSAAGGIADKINNTILKPVDIYTNQLEADAIKLFRKGKFAIRMVIMKEDRASIGGHISLKYEYLNNYGEVIKQSSVYPVSFRDKSNYDNLFIDIDHPLGKEFPACLKMRFKNDLIFHPNGTVTQ